MSLRKSTPEPLQHLGRRLYVATGERTAWARVKPDFILVGGQRCGTTSLFRALMEHPQIVRPTFHKGVNYFDLQYHKDRDWYAGHFPSAWSVRRRTRGHGRPVVFEASGYYMYHPFAMQRLAHDLPGVKLVVMLRDPVERAYSAYRHEKARGYEWETFERALALEEERLVGELARMKRDPTYESFCHRHHSYTRRGHYAEQLSTIYSLFPRSQVHIMESEAFFLQPQQEFAALSDFLGLEHEPRIQFHRYNAQPRGPMSDLTRGRLTNHFQSHDEGLAKLLGRLPRWMTAP